MTTETCQSLECTTPEVYAYSISSERNLFLSYEGTEEIPVLTENYDEILL